MLVGANFQDGTCDFIVWAPQHDRLSLLLGGNERFELQKTKNGYWVHTVDGMNSSIYYSFELNGCITKPDPASHFQPNGVFGPSAVVDHKEFEWIDDEWKGLNVSDLVFYELHVGTFTPQGTFRAVQDRIKELANFGVTAVELMPITQFSGKRNWGYDGVFPYAIQNTYGKPNDLKALVNECHLHGIALFIDLVYNHLGPEGNCLNDYGPYFPGNSMGRWGATINLDGPGNEGVRNYFLENVLHWFIRYHIDGIRLDAVLSMQDKNPNHFLQQLNETVDSLCKKMGKKFHLIAESGYNVPEVLTPRSKDGYEFDGQWLDDFQHSLFAPITGEKEGYYGEYGSLTDLMEVLSDAYVYVGDEFSFKRRKSDESYRWIPADKFIVFSQNHDQVGNRLLGDRLISIAGLEAAKLAAGLTLLSPYVPLLFMGEEYGETAPFLFFTDYKGPALIESIREGRRREFASFHWKGEVPDPQSLETFKESTINWHERYSDRGKKIVAYYNALINLRKTIALFYPKAERQIKKLASKGESLLFIHKGNTRDSAAIIANFKNQPSIFEFPFGGGVYKKVLDSADNAWGGKGTTLKDKAFEGEKCSAVGFNFSVYLNMKEKGETVG